MKLPKTGKQMGQSPGQVALEAIREMEAAMPKIAGDPLRKVTLNLYDADVEWFQEVFGQGYTEQIRNELHKRVQQMQATDRKILEGP